MGRVISTAIQFTDAFSNPAKKTIDNMKKMSQEAKRTGKSIQSAGKTISSAGASLTKTVTAPVAGIATASIKLAADFEKSMSQVAATMGTTTDNIGDLTELAERMGQKTAFSASEAADGINTLAMAGLNASEISASLEDVLNLASAGSLDLSSAASYVTGAVKGFGDTMDNAKKYADLMAKGATLASTDVDALGEAISYGSSTAANYSQSADSMTLSLLRLAEQNVTGQTAATSLNRAMSDLYAPTTAAQKALDNIGVSAYNADGSAKDFNTVVDELSGALKGMSEEQANTVKSTIFTTNGMRAFNNMTASSSKRVKELKAGLESASGSAAQQAETQIDNLSGQLTILKSGLEAAGIAIGNKLLPYIKNAVQMVKNATEWFNSLSDAQVTQIMKWAGIAAAIGPCLVVFGKAVSGVGKMYMMYSKLTGAIASAGSIMKLMTSPAAIVIAVLAAIALATVLVIKNWDKIKPVVMNVKQWFTETFGDSIKKAMNVFHDTFRKVMDGVSTVLSREKGFINGVKETAIPVIQDIASAVKGKLPGAISAIVPIAKSVFSTVENVIKAAVPQVIKVAGTIKGAIVTIAPVIKGAFSNIRNIMGTVIPPVMKVAGAVVGAIVTIVEKTLPVIQKIAGMFQAVFSRIAIIVRTAVNVLSPILQGIATIVSNALRPAFNLIVAIVRPAMKMVVATIGNVLSTGIDIVISIVNGLKDIIGGLIDTIGGIADFVAGVFSGDWKKAWQGVQGIFKGIFETLGGIVKTPLNIVKNLINGYVKQIKSIVSIAINSIGGVIQGVVGIVRSVVGNISGAISVITGVASSVAGTVKGVLSGAFDVILTAADSVIKRFRPAFSIISTIVKTVLGVVKKFIRTEFTGILVIITTIVESIKTVINGLKTTFNGIITFITGVFTGNWRKAWEGVKGIFKGIFEALSGLCKTPINAVITLINKAISGINGISVDIPKGIPGVGGKHIGFHIPTIPALAKGTPDWKGGIAQINEKGGEIVDLPKGSRVYPHDQSLAMAKRKSLTAKSESRNESRSKNINITIPKLADKIIVREQQDIDEIAEAMANKLRDTAINMPEDIVTA